MTKRKPKFIAGRTVAKRIGADALRAAVEKILSGESTIVQQTREIVEKKGYPVVSTQALQWVMKYVRNVGIEEAHKAWGTPLGGPRVEQ